MKYLALTVLLGIGLTPLAASAKPSPADDSLTPAQELGKKTFQQRCSICHTPLGNNGKTYGPPLSKSLVEGNEDFIRNTISNGIDDRMPGFKYGLQPNQINAIIEYLKTVNKTDVKGDINGAVNAD